MDLRQNLSLKKPLFYSTLAHFLIAGLILFTPPLHLKKPSVKVVWVELPKGASEEIELKMKESEGLPKTTIQEQKEALKEPPPPTKEKPMVQPPPKTPPKPALRPIQKEPLPKKPKKMSDVEKALAALSKKRPAPPEAAQIKEKGEGFKYGTGTEPLRVPPDDPERLAYVAKIRAKIKEEWILPPAYVNVPNPPTVTVILYINEDGEIVSAEWETKSNNPAIDSSFMRAVQRASPLPIPPQRLKWEASQEGFTIALDPSLKVQ